MDGLQEDAPERWYDYKERGERRRSSPERLEHSAGQARDSSAGLRVAGWEPPARSAPPLGSPPPGAAPRGRGDSGRRGPPRLCEGLRQRP